MASIADIAVSLTAQTAGFETNIERAAKKSKSAFKSMSDDIAFFGNAVKAGVAGFLTQQAALYFDKIDGAVKKLNVSIAQSRTGTNDFGKIAKELYTSLPLSIDQAAEAVQKLANKTTLTGEAFKNAAKQAAAFASLTGGSSGEFVSGSVAAMKKWGVDESRFNDYTNFLYSVAKENGLGAEGVAKLNAALLETDDTLGRFGFSIENAAIFLAQLEKNGFDSSGVIRGLNESLKQMVEEGRYNSFVEAFEKTKEYILAGRTEQEQLQRSIEAFGKKTGAEFVEIFHNSAIHLHDSSVAMSDLQKDAEGAISNMQKLDIITKNIADHLATAAVFLLTPASDALTTIDKNVKAGLFPTAQLGIGAKKADILAGTSWQPPLGAGGLNLGGAQLGIGAIKVGELQKLEESSRKLSDTQTKVTTTTNQTVAALQKESKAVASVTSSVKWMNHSMTELFGKTDTWKLRLEKFAHELDSNITDSFMDIIQGTKSVSEAFRNMALNIINYILKIQIQENIARPISTALTNLAGGFVNSWFGGGVSLPSNATTLSASTVWDGPIAADGGYLPMGQLTLVGERGPELFLPSAAGQVIPNHELGGLSGGDFHLNQTINVQAGIPAAISAAVKQAVAESTQQAATAVAQTVRKGGRLSRIIRQA